MGIHPGCSLIPETGGFVQHSLLVVLSSIQLQDGGLGGHLAPGGLLLLRPARPGGPGHAADIINNMDIDNSQFYVDNNYNNMADYPQYNAMDNMDMYDDQPIDINDMPIVNKIAPDPPKVPAKNSMLPAYCDPPNPCPMDTLLRTDVWKYLRTRRNSAGSIRSARSACVTQSTCSTARTTPSTTCSKSRRKRIYPICLV